MNVKKGKRNYIKGRYARIGNNITRRSVGKAYAMIKYNSEMQQLWQYVAK